MILPRESTSFLLLSLATALGCGGTETDNPVLDTGSPDHRSPIRFEPEPPVPPACPPPDEDGPPRGLPLWGRSGNHLVGVDVVGSVPRRGLLVIDASDPAAPRVVAEQPLYGYPRQLVVEGTSATLVIDELAMFEGLPVPEPAALEAHTKLVRFDLSTPSAPRRVAEVALEGEFWQLESRAGSDWVMSGRLSPQTLRCDAQPHPCGDVQREAMVFTRYTWDGAAFSAAQRLELPAGPRAWLTREGFATATSSLDAGGSLNVVAWAGDGSAAAPRSIVLDSGVVQGSPVYFDDQHVGVFVYDLTDGSAAFALYDLAGAELGRVAGLSQGLGRGTRFVRGGALVAAGNPNEAAAFIDFSDPGALRVVRLPDAAELLPLDAPGAAASRALGWKADAGGSAPSFSLWSLEAGGITLLDRLPTTLPSLEDPGGLTLDGSRVLFSARAADGSRRTGSVRWDGDQLTLQGPIAGGYGDQRLGVGEWVYEPDALGLAFANPAQSVAARESWSEGEVRDVAAVPGGEARLVHVFGEGMRVRVTRAGGTESLAVSPGARRLLPAGERLIVVSSERADACGQSGLDCSDYAPSLSIVALDPARIVRELPLPELPVPALGPLSRVEQTWDDAIGGTRAPVRWAGQTWLLESEFSAVCQTGADCAALGIDSVPFAEARVNSAQVSCVPPPGSDAPLPASPCPSLPEPTVYGEARRRVFYVLDAAAETLSDPLVVERDRGTPYALWTRPVPSGGLLLDLRLEPSSFPAPGAPPPTSSAFLLERYALGAAGGLEALPIINIPGYPLALLDERTVLSAEPETGANGAGQLHRLELRGQRATVQASRPLPARYGEVKIVGSTVVYVRQPASSCDAGTRIETFALDAALTPLGTLELPGAGWRAVGSGDRDLVLQYSDGRSFARVGIDPSGHPSLAHFATAPHPVEVVRASEDVVEAIGGGALRLPL